MAESNALAAAALVIAAGKKGGGAAPSQYLKNAAVSGNTLTLTKKDDTTVTFTPAQPDVNKAYVDTQIAGVEAKIPTVPTKVSAFTNDAGYLTQHQSLSAYRTASAQDTIDASKQDKLTAGTNITIASDGKTISATDTKYTAGSNIQINNNVISATDTIYDDTEVKADIASLETRKQDVLIAGSNITIAADGKTISATGGGTTYTAGSNITIDSNNIISATDTTYTAGAGIKIENNVISLDVQQASGGSY